MAHNQSSHGLSKSYYIQNEQGKAHKEADAIWLVLNSQVDCLQQLVPATAMSAKILLPKRMR
eukprot:2601016-Pleurochrysis_carterae.AAC.5